MKENPIRVPDFKKRNFVKAHSFDFKRNHKKFAECARFWFGYSDETYWKDIYESFRRAVKRGES